VKIEKHDKQKKYWLPAKIKKVELGTPGVTALELIKRAYESKTLDKLRDFLNIEPQLVRG